MMYRNSALGLICFWVVSLQDVWAFAPILPVSRRSRAGLAMSEEQDDTTPSLVPAETAVLFCKYQNDFASPGGDIYESTTREVMEATGIMANSVALLNFCRSVGVQVVHCPISIEPGQCPITTMPYGVVERIVSAGALKPNTWGAQICDAMEPVEGDWIFPKYGMCAFSTSNLDEYLRGNGIKNVIVVGFLTNGSVESTIRTAYERCYNVYVLPECCAACSMEEHLFSVQQNFPLFATLADGVTMMKALASGSEATAQ